MGWSTATEARPARSVEPPAATRAITATSFVRSAAVSFVGTGTAASSLACGPIARTAGRRVYARDGRNEATVVEDVLARAAEAKVGG